MLSFKHIYNAEKAKAVCNMYTDIEKTFDRDGGKIWIMTAHFWNNTHKVKVIQVASGDYQYKIDEGNFVCSFDGDQITIKEGVYNGRKCKAERSLKQFESVAMMLYALVKCGKLN